MKNEFFKITMIEGDRWIDLIILDDLTVRLDSNITDGNVASVFAKYKKMSDVLMSRAEEHFKGVNNATADR